eukprot:gene27386-36154_t
MDDRIFEVDDDDELHEFDEDSVWADVSSESGDESEAIHVKTISEEDLLAMTRANEIKPFKKKLNKIYSLFIIVALVLFLAYLDYVNEFQIKKLISNFQITPKSSVAHAKNLAKYSKHSAKQVDVVVYFIEKDTAGLQNLPDLDSSGIERKQIIRRSNIYSYFHKNVIKKAKQGDSL